MTFEQIVEEEVKGRASYESKQAEVWDETHRSRERFCVPTAGLNVLREYLG